MTEPLNELMTPSAGRPWGCMSCKLFQYSPRWNEETASRYTCKLDPNAHLRKPNKSLRLELPLPDGEVDVLVVEERPTMDEDRDGAPFASASHAKLKRFLNASGINFSEWHFSYLTRCYVGPNVDLNVAQLKPCAKFLAREVEKLKPRVIITLGQKALVAVLGKQDASIAHYVCQPQNAVVAGHPCIIYPMQAVWYVSMHDYLAPEYARQFVKLSDFLAGKTEVLKDDSAKSIIEDPDDAIALCKSYIEKAVEKGTPIEVDLETSSLNPYKEGARLSVVSLSRNTKRGFAIMFNHDEVPWTKEDRARVIEEGLKPLLTHPKAKLVWHNGKFDVKWVAQHFGFWPRDQWEDTMLTHYAAEENVEHGLKPLALMLTDMGDYDAELDRVLKNQGLPDSPRYDLVEKNLLGKYAAMDTIATAKLSEALRPMVDAQDEFVHALAYRAMPAFSATLTRMEHNGCAIDTDYAKNVIIPLLNTESEKSYNDILAQPVVRQFIRDKERDARQKYIDGLKGRKDKKTGKVIKKYNSIDDLPPRDQKQFFDFSLGSANQLCELFYDARYYNHEAVSFTDSGKPSTDKEALNDLVIAGSPIATAIVNYRQDDKIVGTYGTPLLERLAENCNTHKKILHGSFLAHGTKTGRLSSRDPNLQNQPNKLNGIVKRNFVSRYGDEGVFLQIDFSQIELRILAAVSNDPHMVEAYRTGKDLHMLTACMIFDLTEQQYKALPDKEQKRMRTVAKRLNFGIAYGIGGEGIQHTLKMDGVSVSKEQAREYLDTFASKYPRVAAWIERVEQSTDNDTYSRSLFGRRRRLIEVTSGDYSVKARAHRQGVNHVIQSTAGDLTMTALALFDQEVCLRRGDDPRLIHPTIRHFDNIIVDEERWSKCHINLQVHDMIGADCHRSVAEEATDRLLDIMQNVVDYAPMVWGDCVIKSLAPLKRVPILAEAEVGPNWRDAHGVKSGKDVDLAMFVANAKKERFDADPKAKWSKDDTNAAIEKYKAAA